jgi:hypothetical protein
VPSEDTMYATHAPAESKAMDAIVSARAFHVASPSRRGGLWTVHRNYQTRQPSMRHHHLFHLFHPSSFVNSHSTYRAIDMPSTRSRSTDDAAEAPTSKRSRRSTSETANKDVVNIHSRYKDQTASFRLISSDDVAFYLDRAYIAGHR